MSYEPYIEVVFMRSGAVLLLTLPQTPSEWEDLERAMKTLTSIVCGVARSNDDVEGSAVVSALPGVAIFGRGCIAAKVRNAKLEFNGSAIYAYSGGSMSGWYEVLDGEVVEANKDNLLMEACCYYIREGSREEPKVRLVRDDEVAVQLWSVWWPHEEIAGFMVAIPNPAQLRKALRRYTSSR